jgi:hydroxymethylpyrimidine pyrophosphatase-like HAD family hydrolase
MKQSYKLLVVDIDGTLVNSRGTISEEDKLAIDIARKSGVHVALSTGRAAMASKWVLEQLKMDGYHIFFDGALVYATSTPAVITTLNRTRGQSISGVVSSVFILLSAIWMKSVCRNV